MNVLNTIETILRMKLILREKENYTREDLFQHYQDYAQYYVKYVSIPDKIEDLATESFFEWYKDRFIEKTQKEISLQIASLKAHVDTLTNDVQTIDRIIEDVGRHIDSNVFKMARRIAKRAYEEGNQDISGYLTSALEKSEISNTVAYIKQLNVSYAYLFLKDSHHARIFDNVQRAKGLIHLYETSGLSIDATYDLLMNSGCAISVESDVVVAEDIKPDATITPEDIYLFVVTLHKACENILGENVLKSYQETLYDIYQELEKRKEDTDNYTIRYLEHVYTILDEADIDKHNPADTLNEYKLLQDGITIMKHIAAYR